MIQLGLPGIVLAISSQNLFPGKPDGNAATDQQFYLQVGIFLGTKNQKWRCRR
jgi:hypothetical protein